MASGTIDCICLHCDTHFFRQPNQVSRGENKFCSVPCKRAFHVKTPAQRLWEKVDQSGGPDACWPYASVKEGVYAIVGYNAGTEKWKGIGAHVLAYMLTNGPVPQGMLIRHSCDNRRCCNPAHLIPGDQKENMKDAIDRGRISHGRYHKPNSKLTETQVREIRSLIGIRSQAKIAQQFHVSVPTINAIVRGRAWVDIKP